MIRKCVINSYYDHSGQKGKSEMNRINYNMKEHGFVGHLLIPEQSTKYGVIVIMGGEQSLLPGTLIADRFADYGIA